MAVLLASTSDLDDLIPTLVAYQVEWNKLRRRARGRRPEGDDPDPPRAPRRSAARRRTGPACARPGATWLVPRRGPQPAAEPAHPDARRLAGGLRADDAALVAPVQRQMEEQGAATGRSTSSPPTRTRWSTSSPRRRGRARPTWCASSRSTARRTCARSSSASARAGPRARGRTSSTSPHGCLESLPEDGEDWERRRTAEHSVGVRTSPRARRCACPPRSSRSTGSTRRARPAAGWRRRREAREVGRGGGQHRVSARPRRLQHPARGRRPTDTVRGVYVLGKAATLNADVGDVLISGVIHDEHSGSTYWLDNAFSFDDIAPFLRFGSGLDNQRAVTVKSTFLQNREYLDFYYREAYTVVEMEAGPFCNAVYEIADAIATRSARRSTSPSSRSTSGSSTTPLTPRTRRRARSAPAGCPTTAWTRRTRARSRSCAGSSRSKTSSRRRSACAAAGAARPARDLDALGPGAGRPRAASRPPASS